MTKRFATLCFFLVVVLGIAAGPAAASGPLSPRVLQVEEALTTWIDAGGRGPVALPEYLGKAVRGLPEPGVPLAPGFDPEITLLIQTEDPEMLRMAGYTVRTSTGTVVTAVSPLSRLRPLGSVPGVRWVEIPRPLRPLLDVSRLEILADDVHASAQPPYPGSTGAGVVVCIIDTGIDLDHPDFWTAGGTSRITRVWDQTDGGGPAPPGLYGTEWTESAINAGTTRQQDTDGHGTHVSGIAVANGRGATSPSEQYDFTGIAPEAEIFFVKTNFQEDGIIDAINWAWNRAASKPAVVNLSLGSQFGPHDGTGTLDLALSSLSGPGRILVAAAGNEGNQSIHAEFSIPASGIVQFPFSVGSYTPSGGSNNDILLIDGWYAGSGLEISILTPNGTTVGPVRTTSPTQVSNNTAQGTVRLEQALDPANGDRNVLIDIWDAAGIAPASGTWNIRVQNTSTTTARLIDFWISYAGLGNGATVRFTDNGQITNRKLVSTPASADSVFAVAAYVTKTSWPCVASPTGCGYSPAPTVGNIASFSSPGPRRDGWQKPEISAPGMGIASTLSSDATSGLFTSNFARLPGLLRYVSQGTSQASPHIAGVVALILQNRPTASFQEVSQAIILSARQDAFTGPGFTPTFGHGKVDAFGAVSRFVPVRLLSLSAAWESGAAVLRWELAETEPGARFLVERGPAEDGPFAAVSEYLAGDLSFRWTDSAPAAAEPWYRLVSLDRAGVRGTLGTIELAAARPVLRLWPNAPNPFRASTTIAFQLAEPSDVRLEILDLAGRRVATLLSDRRTEGRHDVEWNGFDDAGRRAAAGIYFYRLVTREGVLANRMVLTN